MHYLSLFEKPVEIVKEIKRHHRDFLWASSKEKDVHLVNQEDCSRSKEKGGLGGRKNWRKE